MKYSVKSSAMKVLPKLKIGIKPSVLAKEAITQVILLCDRILWTEMSEKYLTTSTYEDYKLLLRKEEERVLNFLKEANKELWIQTAMRATQQMHLREIGTELLRDQITPSDFKWKEQIRMYSNDDDIFVCHLDGKLPYLCEYRPPRELNIPTSTSTRYLYESYRAVQTGNSLVVGGLEG